LANVILARHDRKNMSFSILTEAFPQCIFDYEIFAEKQGNYKQEAKHGDTEARKHGEE
jgi:hypothetical protein